MVIRPRDMSFLVILLSAKGARVLTLNSSSNNTPSIVSHYSNVLIVLDVFLLLIRV